MPPSKTSAAVVDTLWERMVGLAESAHNVVVHAQRKPSSKAAGSIDRLARDLSALAQAAELLMRRGGRGAN
jgi:hypothetical protein